MALVKYIGPEPSVYVPEAGASVLKGNSLTVTNELAVRLLQQTADWEAGNKETEELSPILPVPIQPVIGYAEEYEGARRYPAGVLVEEGGGTYLSLKSTTGEAPSSHPAAWRAIGAGVSQAEIEAALPGSVVSSSAPGFPPSVIWLDTTPEFYGAVGDGSSDDTAAIKACEEAIHARGSGVMRLSAKTYIVDNWEWLDGVQHKGTGTTVIKAKAGSSSSALVTIPVGRVRYGGWEGIRFQPNGNVGQSCFSLHGQESTETGDGGVWYGLFKDLEIGSSSNSWEGDCIWLQASATSANAPHQFVGFSNVRCWSKTTGANGLTSRCVKITGNTGQLSFDKNCLFNGTTGLSISEYAGTLIECSREYLFATTLSAEVAAGASSIKVTSATGFEAGKVFSLGEGAFREILTVASVSGTTVNLTGALEFKHVVGINTYLLSGSVATPAEGAPYNVAFTMGTFQNADLAVYCEHSNNIMWHGAHFENTKRSLRAVNISHQVGLYQTSHRNASSEGVSNGTGVGAAGSNTLTNCTGTWVTGNVVAAAGVPAGTTVTNVTGTTIELSANIVSTGAQGSQTIVLVKGGKGEGYVAKFEGASVGAVVDHYRFAASDNDILSVNSTVSVRNPTLTSALAQQITRGITIEIPAAESLKVLAAPEVVLSTAATIKTILGQHTTGESVRIRATVNGTTFATGGNLGLASSKPLKINAGEYAEFARTDREGLPTWLLVDVQRELEGMPNASLIDICRDFGARPNTDITAAFNEAMAAVTTLGGGTIYFSIPGTYLIEGALKEGEALGYKYAGQILFPARTVAQGRMVVSLLGCSPVRKPWFQGSPAEASSLAGGGGVLLKSNATSGNIFDVIPGFAFESEGVAYPFSNILVTTEKLVVQAPANPQCGGLKMDAALGYRQREVVIEPSPEHVGVNNELPTGPNPALSLPAAFNNGVISVKDSAIYGWGTGLRHSEHAVLDLFIGRCAKALDVRGGNGKHISTYVNVNVEGCPVALFTPKKETEGGGGVIAGVLDVENYETGGLKTTAVIEDEGSLLRGTLVLEEEVTRASKGFPVKGARNLDFANPYRGGAGHKNTYPRDSFLRVTNIAKFLGTCVYTSHPWQTIEGEPTTAEPSAGIGAANSAVASGVSAAAVRFVNRSSRGSRTVTATLNTGAASSYSAQITLGSVISGANEGNFLYVQCSGNKWGIYKRVGTGTQLVGGGVSAKSSTYLVEVLITCPPGGGAPTLVQLYVGGELILEHTLSTEEREQMADLQSYECQDGIRWNSDTESTFTAFQVSPTITPLRGERGAEGQAAPATNGVLMPVVARGAPIPTSYTVPGTANKMSFVRAIVPSSGKIKDISIPNGEVVAGNVRVAVYDTGDASPGKYTLLWQSAVIAQAGAKGWQSMGAPELTVTPNQEVMLGVMQSSATASFGIATNNASSFPSKLPASYMPVAGGTEPKLAAIHTGSSLEFPASLTEAEMEAGSPAILIIGRVA